MFGLKKEKKSPAPERSSVRGESLRQVKAVGTSDQVVKNLSRVAAGSVLVRPVVSEKALGGEGGGKYMFRVRGEATKPEVKKEIEKLYRVKVTKINMITVQPRPVFFRGRTNYRSGFKKTVVKLAAGQKIEVLPKQ
ncbi:MAG: 50S ribosomal protein L23 [Minisyncoccia bacterium]